MCGFVGILALSGGEVDAEDLARRTDSIRHRGPDDFGYWRADHVGLGFRRLSILDLSDAGHQPMLSSDGRFVMVFNGEIYNFAELRTELAALGHRFVSTGDTDVLLHAFMEWGTACVDRLNGMWAFLIYDRQRKVLFGSRDRLGVKPLYLRRTANAVMFASEIKALRTGTEPLAPEWSRVADWLLSGSVDSVDVRNGTFLANVDEIAAGSAFEVSPDGVLRTWTYWSLDDAVPVDAASASERFAELFEDSMRLQSRADVPVGVSLSGGLDSTSILCSLSRIRGAEADPIVALCYMSAEHDERQYIEATLAATNSRLHEIVIQPGSMFDGLTTMLRFHDEPVHSLSALIGFEIMRAARAAGIKVMLSGQGADEPLAGYPNFFRAYWAQLVREGERSRAEREIAQWAAVHGGDATAMLAAATKRARRINWRRRVPGYGTLADTLNARRVQRHPWFTGDLTKLADGGNGTGHGKSLRDERTHATMACPMPVYLRIEDRNSMAHGVEGRVPFLDHRLVELAFGLPDHMLLRGPLNKFVLRDAMRSRIPDLVQQRMDKMGFPHPRKSWFQTHLADASREILSDQQTRESGMLNTSRILHDLERHGRGDGDFSGDLFNVVQLEIWRRSFGPQAA